MEIDIRDFGARRDGSDSVPALRAAMEKLRGFEGAKRLLFPKGKYEFWPDRAEESYLFPSNNDEGLKRIAFRIDKLSALEIDGDGSDFIFHGGMIPFAIANSRSIALKGFSIDYKRPFHSEAFIAASGEGRADLEIDKSEFPYEIVDGALSFIMEDGERQAAGHMLEFDSKRRETAFMVHDTWRHSAKSRAEELPGGLVRLHADFSSPGPQAGNTLVFGSEHRKYPGIFCESSSELLLSGIAIHHSGGMGVIAQRCSGIRLEKLSVTPSKNGRRMVSTSADATHFVNCKGRLELIGCLFENQMDDPSNIHGIYAKIVGRPSAKSVEIKLMHRQQFGVKFIDEGDFAEVVDSKTLLSYHEAPVKKLRQLNKEIFELSFDEELPASLKIGDSVGNASWSADLTIKGCSTRSNRARGFLISTPGKVLVEGNVFHNAGAAILLEGDANYWYEAGAVKDVAIRGNRFENCNYGTWGRACIQATPGVSPEIKTHVPYHRNIRIEGNRFISFGRSLLYARCVDGISFKGNIIEKSDAYPCSAQTGIGATLDGCANVEVKDNIGGDAWALVVNGERAGTLQG